MNATPCTVTHFTMFKIAPFGAAVKRGQVYPVHGFHLFFFQLHTLDQCCNDLPASLPIRLVQACGDLR